MSGTEKKEAHPTEGYFLMPRPPTPNGSTAVAFGEGEEGMSGLWKCACQKGKERTRRPAPIPTSVGRLGYSLATRSSANVASASPSRSDDTRDRAGSQASLPEALHAFFTSAAERRAPFAASVSARGHAGVPFSRMSQKRLPMSFLTVAVGDRRQEAC